MTVKDLMEILSKQNPDNEVTFTKKTWVNGYAWYDNGHYEYAFNRGDYDEYVFNPYCTAGTSTTGTATWTNLMIRLASDPDDTWQPYAETNYQLTYDVAQALNSIVHYRDYVLNGKSIINLILPNYPCNVVLWGNGGNNTPFIYIVSFSANSGNTVSVFKVNLTATTGTLVDAYAVNVTRNGSTAQIQVSTTGSSPEKVYSGLMWIGTRGITEGTY